MILGVFIDFFFLVKIVIGLSKNHCDLIITVVFDLSQNSRFTDILSIFTYILLIFFQKFHTCVREIKS